MALQAIDKQHLTAIVDMGSNGIRFSISDLSPSTARIMPTVFQDRAGISLYDAQYSTGVKSAIPPATVLAVLHALSMFKRTCEDFEVPNENVRVLATEATREAINSVEFRALIKEKTGWDVEMLPKEEEGRVGAMGVASSFRSVNGLVMDLGGGSTQLTWMSEKDGEVSLGQGGSVSLPYGAAALLRRLQEAESQRRDVLDALKREVQGRLLEAYKAVAPTNAAQLNGGKGFPLFLSGGGFRGWGNVLMDTHPVQPYPIPIINGFAVNRSAFTNASSIQAHVASTESIFRVSERRASQIPAVAFLVTALTEVLPTLTSVRFCQGGVREGALFDSLPAAVRSLPPLSVATHPYTAPSSSKLSALLISAVPPPPSTPQIIFDLLTPLIHLLYYHLSLPKEGRPAAALRSTTTGLLAGVHGLLHTERAALALMLCERWGGPGDLSSTDEEFAARLQQVLEPEVAWWATYVGRVGALIGEVFPAGVVKEERVRFQAALGSKGIYLDVKISSGVEWEDKALHGLEKPGKKNHWIGGRDGWGMKVHVVLSDL